MKKIILLFIVLLCAIMANSSYANDFLPRPINDVLNNLTIEDIYVITNFYDDGVFPEDNVETKYPGVAYTFQYVREGSEFTVHLSENCASSISIIEKDGIYCDPNGDTSRRFRFAEFTGNRIDYGVGAFMGLTDGVIDELRHDSNLVRLERTGEFTYKLNITEP